MPLLLVFYGLALLFCAGLTVFFFLWHSLSEEKHCKWVAMFKTPAYTSLYSTTDVDEILSKSHAGP